MERQRSLLDYRGAGGIGRLVAKEAASKTAECILVITGRSELSKEQLAELSRLRELGTRVEYRRVDVTDLKDVESLVLDIVKQYGQLHGIIHCAGITQDQFLIAKTEEEFKEVLAPKVIGLTNLDKASKDLPLDFFIAFSSGTGVWGNPGQSDYATANAFMDRYIECRKQWVKLQQRHGRTLSINWPLWKDGGMQVDNATELRMYDNLGITPMLTESGHQALYRSLASDHAQVLVVEGNVRKLRDVLLEPTSAIAAHLPTDLNNGTNQIQLTVEKQNEINEKTEEYFKKLLSSVTKLPVHRMDADMAFEEYGIDSTMVMQMTSKLEKSFGSLPKTLFFEYRTIRALSQYFVEHNIAKVMSILGINDKFQTPLKQGQLSQSPNVKSRLENVKTSQKTKDQTESSIASQTAENTDIAIIGVSGRYPQSNNLHEFWNNLKSGKHCVTEIPSDRWDHSIYYDAVPGKQGKTYSKWGGFIDGVDHFDPLFFQMSPLEAELISPQERLFLQSVYETLEDAGYTRDSLCNEPGSGADVGVFVGVMYEEYQLYGAQETVLGNPMGVSGSHSSIANRVSYFCNFHGPSLAVDTMCSSSLTALHLACKSLHQEECKLAVAGGVNISIHPNKYLVLGQSKFVSSQGRCSSFGEGGDGYVPGEGVGSVLLKPLAQAIVDGDQIYGVIKGTAINHGGKTSGYTVPNPRAQSKAIRQAFNNAGIDPRTVSYIEAHGTGTALGDPIEIGGLTNVFREYTQDRQFCAIGSVKSNIGHCESASGIAGLTKILLQFKYRKLVPSLHAEVLNPNLDLENSPFMVQRELQEWERPYVTIDGVTRKYPLIAGLSSFGAGGSNAHVVLEEYCPSDSERREGDQSYGSALILLSAKDEDRLRERADQLLFAITAQEISSGSLADVAYTLQVGREAMEERLAMVVDSVDELAEKLEEYVSGHQVVEGIYRGSVSLDRRLLSEFTTDEDLQAAVNGWLSKRKYTKLMKLWVQGLYVDWRKLYSSSSKLHRISLPVYPFAKERYWLPENRKEISVAQTDTLSSSSLHPLVHRNTSDLSIQRFSSTFTGQELFFTDHIVNGQKLMPGGAHLEMAREAIQMSSNNKPDEREMLRLKNVTWTRPIFVEVSTTEIHVAVYPDEKDILSFEIYSDMNQKNADPIVYSSGTADRIQFETSSQIEIKQWVTEFNGSLISAEECYSAFFELGIDYGPGHRVIEELHVGDQQVLAKLSLPVEAIDSTKRYVLHPSMMDGVFQTSIGLMLGERKPQLALPFALDELVIMNELGQTVWVFVKPSIQQVFSDQIMKLDIDVFDEEGNCCLQIRGLALRFIDGPPPSIHEKPELLNDKMQDAEGKEVSGSTSSQHGTTLLVPVWDMVALNNNQLEPSTNDRVLVLGGTQADCERLKVQFPNLLHENLDNLRSTEDFILRLQTFGRIQRIIWIAPESRSGGVIEDNIVQDQVIGLHACYHLIKALISEGYGTLELKWTVVTYQSIAVHGHDDVHPTHAGLHGLVGSMSKEYPNWKVSVVDLESGEDWTSLQWSGISVTSEGHTLVYRGKKWYRQALIPYEDSETDPTTAYRDGGVYLVIGGAGGIGEVWSEYMIRRYHAHIIWIGRRKKDAVIQGKIDRLKRLGPAPVYIEADAASRKEMERAYKSIKKQFANIHGVIHSAVVLSDQRLSYMDEDQFKSVLTAKVDVSVRLAQVFQHEPLDFVLFFSSLSAYGKPKGQSNYSAGCVFTDAFAQLLDREWSCAVKVINWGYWGSVGVVAVKGYQEQMALAGIGSIEPDEAMEALEILLSSHLSQMALLKTTRPFRMEGQHREDTITELPMEEESYLPILCDQGIHCQLTIEDVLSQVQRPIEEFDQMLGKLLYLQLKTIGIFDGTENDLTEPLRRSSLIDRYNRWLTQSLAMLEIRKYIQRNGQSYIPTSLAPDNVESVWKEWNRLKGSWLRDPNLKAQVQLAEATIRSLPKVLLGQQAVAEVLFPNGSMQRVEGIYKDNIVSDFFNEALSATLKAFIQERLRDNAASHFRILEIGAGTGGTTTSVLNVLDSYLEYMDEYCYTDLSEVFLQHAQQEYGSSHPYLTYAIYNVELPAVNQPIEAGQYDVVIASNVLHATKNVRRSLRNAKSLLKTNGILLINEITDSSIFTHVTFGLLDGWWLYEDEHLRIPGCPGLTPESWQSVLESEGFNHVYWPVKEARMLGQQVIAAESNGIVRYQPRKGMSTMSMPANTSQSNLESAAEKHSTPTSDMLRERGISYVKTIIADTLKLSKERIHVRQPFEQYGIDSIIVVKLTEAFRDDLGDLSSTLFFEYQTIEELVDYFMKTKKQQLMQVCGLTSESEIGVSQPETVVHSNVSIQKVTEKRDETISQFSSSPLRITRRTRSFQTTPLDSCTESNDTPEAPADSSAALVNLSSSDDKHSNPRVDRMEIAIIGMSGRFPRASNVNEFWDNLKNGENCISEIPAERWNWKEYFDPEKGVVGKMYTKWGGFIDGIDEFDPAFFQISPREAAQMDPQERLFLQEAYASIEDAGYTPESLASSRKIGVYVGVMNSNYPTGVSYWSIANRLSYLFNFQGPSLAVDTACSSSLTAIHLAAESLLNGTSEVAIAGGVNLIVDPNHYLKLSAATMLSSGSECRSFGDQADGFIDGEAIGAIVLKPLNKAIADGDQIYGVIRGSMLNSGGRTNGYTVPSPAAQAELIKSSLERAQIHARTVSYLEAHGTGTALGDPIEIHGMTKAFEQDTSDKQFCALGSVKSNIGHCESGSGIAGVIKVLLQMKHRQLVPSLHSRQLNSNIDFKNTPFIVQQECAEWKRPVLEVDGTTKEYPRIAGISSFGAGGANTHLLIEEYVRSTDRTEAASTQDQPTIIILSAKTEAQLSMKVQQLLNAVMKEYILDQDLTDMAYTLQVGREAMEERIAVQVVSVKDLEGKLQQYLEKGCDAEDWYCGNTKKNNDMLELFAVDDALKEAVKTWILYRQYNRLLQLWVQGMNVEWKVFYEGKGRRPNRISLPSYPFARERYWISDNWIAEKSNKSNDSFRKVPVSASAESTISEVEDVPVKPNGISLEPVMFSATSERHIDSRSEIKSDPIILQQESEQDATLSYVQEVREESEAVEVQRVQPTVSLEHLEEELSARLAEALYMDIEDLDPSKSFIELGLDSIIGVEWIRDINSHYGTSITATKVYDYPNIREFAGYLRTMLTPLTPSENQVHMYQNQRNKLSSSSSIDALLDRVQSGGMEAEQAAVLLEKLNR
ncbi:SDR family NAD(P)-dependent oxidoreductase [Bacillus paralicheniformis]|uniref:SDR family NAD(P)-dependent oxidoreductase n=1 Tax=Bacillus paralicheniformis TaxID=1648923 RepID=UPI002D798ADD|nr:SDR family NAD(P)-dependent oxidoreductase [Bacillus paralicheniformis]